jgi:TRAP-type C4-dicarboxylate transport system permease small subunit
MTRLLCFNAILQRAISKVLAILLMFMLFSIVAEILVREVSAINFDWVIELNRILFVWIAYLGAAYGFGHCTHIRVEFIYEKLNPRLRKCLDIVIHFLNLVFFFVMSIFGYDMIHFGRSNVFATMNVSYMWLYLPICLFGLFSILFTVENIWKTLNCKEAA